MTLSNKTYDFLNDVVKIGIPSVGTLYFGLAVIWNFPFGEQVVGSLALLATALGVWLKILSNQWAKIPGGTVDVDVSNPAEASVRLDLKKDILEYADGDSVILKINSNISDALSEDNDLPA